MSIKNFVASIFALAAFGSAAMAQGGGQPQPPRQPNQAPRVEGFGRGGGEREFGARRMSGGRRPGMMRAGGGGRSGRLDFNRLNLTDAQKQRIQTLLESNRQPSEAARAQFEEMAKLMRLKREGLLTTEQGTRLTSLQAQMKTDADRRQSELMAILTPEQRTLADQMKNERGVFRGMRGMRGMGGQQQRMPLRRQMPGAPNRPNRPNPPAQPPVQNN